MSNNLFIKKRKNFVIFRFLNRYFQFKYWKIVDGVIGINSLCNDDMHILFIDVDDIKKEELIEKLKAFQIRYNLSTFYIFESSKNNFHIWCLQKFSFGQIMDLLKAFEENKTKQYRVYAAIRNRWVLRISEKKPKGRPVLIEILGRDNEMEKSNAHRLALKKLFGLEDEDLKGSNFDDSMNVGIEDYPTVVNKLTKEDLKEQEKWIKQK